MKFEILSDEYERLGDATQYGTIPLKGKSNKRNFFLDVTAAGLLDLPGGVHDFDGVFKDLDVKQKNEMVDGLRVLTAFGAARIIKEEDKDPDGFKFRVAGEKDYKDVAAFLGGKGTKTYGFVVSGDPATEDNLRANQFNNMEYLFLCRKNGKIVGLTVAIMPKETAATRAFQISGVVVADKLTDEEKDTVVKGLWDYVKKAFEGEFKICRHISYAEDDKFLSYLKDFGFIKTATLEKETSAGATSFVYDLKL
jgi:hypothetical protein